jgi:hypothetical protein
VYISKDSPFECFNNTENGNGWNDISITESTVELGAILVFSVSFSSVLLYVHILYNNLEKVLSNVISVCRVMHHLNNIRKNPPEVNGNPDPSTKRAQEYHNINAEPNKVYDAIVS